MFFLAANIGAVAAICILLIAAWWSGKHITDTE